MSSSQTVPTEAGNEPTHRTVAASWHTAIVILVLFGLSLVGAKSGSLPGVRTYGRAGGYALVMIIEWLTLAFIWYGVSSRGISMSALVGGSWARTVYLRRDLGIAVGFVIICGVGVLNGLGYLLKVGPNQAMRQMFPQTPTEIILWISMSMTAGFCEEVIFRGYLQRQFSALTRAATGGIVLQGIVFGAAHGCQGWKLMLLIAIYGSLFGLLAQWRHSLRPGIIAHFLQDGMGGLLARHLMS
jgi:uncharacterized protein